MRVEKNHAHAYTKYRLLKIPDYILLLRSVIEAKIHCYETLTVHLPFEIQHKEVENLKKARIYIYYGEILKKLFNLRLYWENAPWLNYGSWNLKYGNTDWKNIPKNIEICLDTGHLMLGSKSKKAFYSCLKEVLKERGSQIKHLHLHENDFKSDKHARIPGKIITKSMFKKLIKGRSYIIEKGE